MTYPRPVFALAVLVCLGGALALNNKMENCDKMSMTFENNADMERFKGWWFLTHLTYPGVTKPQIYGAGYWVNKTDPLDVDKRGMEDVEFEIFQLHKRTSAFSQCTKDTFLYENINGIYSSPYVTKWYDATGNFPAGYYVGYYNNYILATDYDNIAVMYVEQVMHGSTDRIYDEIQIWQRTFPSAGQGFSLAERTVINSALQGPCSGGMADPTQSWFYFAIPAPITNADCKMYGYAE